MTTNIDIYAFKNRTELVYKQATAKTQQKFIIMRACELLNNIKDKFNRSNLVSFFSGLFNLPENIILSYTTGQEVASNNVDILIEYLKFEYEIKQDEISGTQIYCRNGKYYTYEELEIMLINNDFNLRNGILKKVLNIDNTNISVVQFYNPLHDYLMTLKNGYKGIPQIKKLCSYILSYEYPDIKKTDFFSTYQERLEYYVHKFIIQSVGQILEMTTNETFLLWISPGGGSGKSRFNKWLFSIFAEEYKAEIGENKSYIPFRIISEKKIVCNFDELPISEKRYDALKSYITGDAGSDYEAKKGYTSYKRRVNFVGSTNKANAYDDKGNFQKGYLLKPDGGMIRRVIPIRVNKFLWEQYTQEIDLHQLWGEAINSFYQAFQNKNKDLLSWENDYPDLRRENLRYLHDAKHTISNETISDYIKPAERGKGTFISAKKLLKYLKEKMDTEINEDKLGHWLGRNGYSGNHNGTHRGWWVHIN